MARDGRSARTATAPSPGCDGGLHAGCDPLHTDRSQPILHPTPTVPTPADPRRLSTAALYLSVHSVETPSIQQL